MMRTMAIHEILLEIKDYTGPGDKPVIDYNDWRAAILNYDMDLFSERNPVLRRAGRKARSLVVLKYNFRRTLSMKRIAIILFIVTIFLSACTAARWVNTPVRDSKNIKVSLEYHQKNGETVQQHYSQPMKVDAGELKALLGRLVYVERVGTVEDIFRKDKQKSVFQTDEVAQLAPAIADALAKANSNQRVRFVSVNKGGGLIFASRRITEGVVFAESPDRLDIAFNVINHELSINEPDELPPDFKYRDPLKVTSAWTMLIPETSYSHLNPLDNGKDSPIWIVVDLQKFQNASKNEAAITAAAEPEAQSASAPPAKIEKTKVKEISEQPPEPAKINSENIESKLKLLKDLFEKELITQQEYDAKKKEILNQIK